MRKYRGEEEFCSYKHTHILLLSLFYSWKKKKKKYLLAPKLIYCTLVQTASFSFFFVIFFFISTHSHRRRLSTSLLFYVLKYVCMCVYNSSTFKRVIKFNFSKVPRCCSLYIREEWWMCFGRGFFFFRSQAKFIFSIGTYILLTQLNLCFGMRELNIYMNK